MPHLESRKRVRALTTAGKSTAGRARDRAESVRAGGEAGGKQGRAREGLLPKLGSTFRIRICTIIGMIALPADLSLECLTP